MALAVFAPLKSRNFALVWSAALVSNVGTWMQTIALGIFVTRETSNPAWTGLVAAAAFLPGGVLAPLGGALADRFDRRRWLMITTAGEAFFATALAIIAIAGDLTPAWGLLFAFFGGCIAAVGFPAYQALLPQLVSADDLFAAVNLSSAQYNLGRVLGPGAASLALVFGSYGLAFGINAASFFAVIIALAMVHLERRVRPAVMPKLLREIRDGVVIAWNEPGCRSAIFLIGCAALLAAPFIALIPAMAIVTLHLTTKAQAAAGTSTLVIAQGIGAVLGLTLVPTFARRVGRVTVLRTVLFATGPLLVIYGLCPGLWSAAALLVLVGACYIALLTGLNAVIQLRVTDAARARVLSLFTFSLATLYTVGVLFQGSIANAVGKGVGVRVVTVCGGLSFFLVLLGVRWLRPSVYASLEDKSTTPAGAS